MNIIVLGGGLVGAPMAYDLAKDGKFNITVADRDQGILDKITSKGLGIGVLRRDLSNPANVTTLVKDFDLVINAVPGFMGFETAKAIIQAQKSCTCISFYEEDPFELDQLAKDNGVSMVVDCGVYPGMGSILIMDAVEKLDKVDSILTYVGGLPQIREWPSEYKAVFSCSDVIEEYVRPARFIENGHKVVRPALSDAEYIFFPKVGSLEAFNTDGLRTLVKTIDAPNMKEKTLRYPGHIEKMTVLRELGFFRKEKILQFNGMRISPLDFTSQVLFPNWTLKKGEGDITVFQSFVKGYKDNEHVEYFIDLHDEYCPDTDVISMARTTGYTATAALRMIAEGLYTDKGVSPPEYLGKYPECVNYMQNELKKRGVNWEVSLHPVNES